MEYKLRLSIDDLRRVTQALATLDAILLPDWEYRSFSFNSKFSHTIQLASMRDGAGNDWHCAFTPMGCFLKGFDHESELSPYHTNPPRVLPGILECVPQEFADCLEEPAFNLSDTTFCAWRRNKDQAWQSGGKSKGDGSSELLRCLDGKPETYCEWAAENYELELDGELVASIYAHTPLTPDMASQLNAAITWDALQSDLTEIAYPTSAAKPASQRRQAKKAARQRSSKKPPQDKPARSKTTRNRSK